MAKSSVGRRNKITNNLFKSFYFLDMESYIGLDTKPNIASLGNVLFPALINVTRVLYKNNENVPISDYDLKYKRHK